MKYLVGLSVGGLMECPDITIKDIQVIEADSEKDAVNTYNVVNKCSYFYGTCLGKYSKEAVELLTKSGKIVSEAVVPEYHSLGSHWFNARSFAYDLYSALKELKEKKASKENIREQIERLADWLMERSLDEKEYIEKNISNINKFVEEIINETNT